MCACKYIYIYIKQIFSSLDVVKLNVVTLKFFLLHITAQPEFGIFMKLLYKSV